MPSTMDLIKWKDKWSRLSPVLRNGVITDTISWLESDERSKCKPEHLSHLINFENELQNLLNQQKVADGWFIQAGQTYGSFPFFASFIRRVL
jgi:hypothetical protein